jgi:hypothetical protein
MSVLIVTNSSIPASLADAQTYCALRGLPVNIVQIAFGTTSAATISEAGMANGTYAVTGAFLNGSASSAYNSLSAYAACGQVMAALSLSCVLFSTYTPVQFATSDGSFAIPALVAAYASADQGQNYFSDGWGWGRLGAPRQNPANAYGWEWENEQTTRSGARVFDVCVPQAIAAEQQNNYGKPVMASTGVAGGTGTVGVSILGDAYGFTTAWYQSYMAEIRQTFSSTLDMQVDYPFDTNAADDWYRGSAPRPCSVFAFCAPFSLQATVPASGLVAGSQPYSDSYTVLPGGWSCHWYSWQIFFALDFLRNGGAAAVTTVYEPTAAGIRNPREFLTALRTGISMARAMSYPMSASPVSGLTFPAYQMPMGDPLYRPYAVGDDYVHRALQILNAVSNAIAVRTDLDAVVLPNRLLTLSEQDQELPAVCPRIAEDNALTDRGVTNLSFIDSQLTIVIALYARASTEAELVLELMRLRSVVHRGVMADRTFGLPFVVGALYLGAAEPELDASGAMLAGRVDCSFAVEYRMNVTDPD